MLTFSIIPTFFVHHEPNNLLIALTGYITAEMFRFIPVSTPNYGFQIVLQIAKHFFNISSIVLVSSSSYKFINIFSCGCLIFMQICNYFFSKYFPSNANS